MTDKWKKFGQKGCRKLMQLPKQDNLDVALHRAQEALRQMDPLERCWKSGVAYRPELGRMEIPFLHRCAHLQWPDMDLTWQGEEPVELRERILVLHYLQKAAGAPLTWEWISFSQVPGGEFYVGPFRQRSVNRLVRVFGNRPEDLVPVAQTFRGWRGNLGDVSVTLPVFPRVPISFALWHGDEEIPPSGNVLFDSSISTYLPVEDISVICGAITGWLCRYSQVQKHTTS